MIAILSDIHGNFPALQAVLADIDRQGCDRVISLGDVAGYYCLVNECIDELRSRNITNLMGNHDQYLAAGTSCPRSHSANLCLKYQRAVISNENLDYLCCSPFELTLGELRMVHGGWKDPLDEYLLRCERAYFEALTGRFFFSGHTHAQALVVMGAQVYCNPGSVGQPRDGDPRAAYAIFDGEKILLQRVAYDVDATTAAMHKAGFAKHLYDNLYVGTRIGGGVTRFVSGEQGT
jgi:predicted phosphodiesterase